MSKDCQRVCLMTALGCCSAFSGPGGGSGQQRRFVYFVPQVGKVCKQAFQAAFNISNDTLTKFRGLIAKNMFAVPEHKHKGNKFARTLDEDGMVRWFEEFAVSAGEVVPVRFRHRKKVDGEVALQYSKKDYRLLPSYCIWEMLRQHFLEWMNERDLVTVEPSLTSFRRILEMRCPTIKIRSPRDNVCDACVIYRNTMGVTPSVEQTEAMVSHVQDARSMRRQYLSDCQQANAQHMVTTLDYAQNVVLPHSAQTPSMWYFLSLVNISVFGVYNQPDERQWNFIYSERKAGKSSNEVISMLDSFARMRGIYGAQDCSIKSWTLYADNCGGQNKNNFMLRYLLFLVHSKALDRVVLNFLIKGHTKNHCDRGFANIKRYYARRDIWTLSMLADAVRDSATTNNCVVLEDNSTVLRDFKSPLQGMYRDLRGIQRYQIFSMDSSEPGVVRCRKRPASTPVVMNLLAPHVDKELTSDAIAAVWGSMTPLEPPPLNKEKVLDVYKKVLPYVPESVRNDPLYIVPDDEDNAAVRATKRARRKKTTPRLSAEVLAELRNAARASQTNQNQS